MAVPAAIPITPKRIGSTGEGFGITSEPIDTTTPESAHEHSTLMTFVATAMVLGLVVSPAPCRVMPPTVITARKGMLSEMMRTNSVP